MSGAKEIPIPKTLAELGFVRPPKNTIKRVNGVIIAPQKSGKTEFVCGMPEPVAIVSTDEGVKNVVEKHVRRGKDIFIKEFKSKQRWDFNLKLGSKMSPDIQAEYQSIWRDIQKAYKKLLEAPLSDVRSIGIDTATEWYEIARFAEWGAASVGKFQFGPMNQMLRELFRAAMDSDKNVLFTTRMKKQYKGGDGSEGSGSWDGKSYEMAGFQDLKYCVENVVLLSRDGEDGDFRLDVESSRVNGKLFLGRDDSQLNGASNVNFIELAKMLYPDTDDEDWGG